MEYSFSGFGSFLIFLLRRHGEHKVHGVNHFSVFLSVISASVVPLIQIKAINSIIFKYVPLQACC